MKTIPMCWKCASAIMKESEDMSGAFEMVGCKEHKEIEDWESAKALCPLIHESRDV